MRILLVNTNACRDLLPPPPIGLSYLATATERAGHEVRLLDLQLATQPAATLRAALLVDRPDVVGFSIRNLDNLIRERLSDQITPLGSLIAVVRAETDAPIVLGGSAVSIAGAAVLRHLEADYAIVGEGEVAFVALLSALEGQAALEQVPGLVRSQDGTVTENPPRPSPTFGSSGMERWLSWRRYEGMGSTWAIQGKRGCPLGCTYCLYGTLEGSAHRLRSPGDIVEEMRRVSRAQRPRAFEFVDSTFNLPADHAMALCESIAAADLHVPLTAQGFNPLGDPRELVPAMERAGFNSFMVSPEAASDPILERLGKGFSVEHVHRTREAARASGMVTLWFFMLGGPGETDATAEETISFAERWLDWDRCVAVFFTGVRILPGTGVARVAREQGLITAGDDLVAAKFYFSPDLDERRLMQRLRRAAATRPAFLHAAEEDAVIQRLLGSALPLLGVAPPFWRFLPRLLRSFPLRQLRRMRPGFSLAGVS